MSDDADPFGIGGGRTRVRPPPGPRRESPRRAPADAPAPRSRDHPNRLVGAFAGLLALAPELPAATAPADPEDLRARLLAGLVAARDAAAPAVTPIRAEQATWAVAALLDDLALNTPWGGASAWPRQPLVSTLYGDVDAGTRFFGHVDALERSPGRDPEMLGLFATCLALGFRGKFRVPSRAGDRSLAAIRTAIARLVHDPDAEAAPLSPNWQGVAVADRAARNGIPVWAMLAIAAGATAALYFFLTLRLDAQAARLLATASHLPPPEQAEIIRPGQTLLTPLPTSTAGPPPTLALAPELIAAVPNGVRPAIRASETPAVVSLTVQYGDPELFQSASANLTPGFGRLFTALGAALADNLDLIGTVTVTGHTDSVPLSPTSPLRNNDRLSEARAETAASLLVQGGLPPDRIRTQGRGAREPVAANDTRAGRALNRRIEILVGKQL